MAPTAVGEIGERTLFISIPGRAATAVTIDLMRYFRANSGLSYTARSDDTAVATVTVNGASNSDLTITPVGAGNTMITVTADDGVNPSVEQVFAVKVVQVMADGGTVASEDGVGVWAWWSTMSVVSSDNDVRLILPDEHAVSMVMVGIYDPSAATVAALPDGATFSGVSVDIELDPSADNQRRHICLPRGHNCARLPVCGTAGVPEGRMPDLDLSLARLQGQCYLYGLGNGRNRRRYHRVDSHQFCLWHYPRVFSIRGRLYGGGGGGRRRATATRLNEQILTRASQAMTASTLAAVAARVDAVAGGGAAVAARVDAAAGVGGAGGATGAGATPTLAYQFGGQSSLRGLFDAHGRAMLEGEMEYERLLEGASFVLPLAAADGDSAAIPRRLPARWNSGAASTPARWPAMRIISTGTAKYPSSIWVSTGSLVSS